MFMFSYFSFSTFLFFSLLKTAVVLSAPISISQQPCTIAYTPNSVLADPPSSDYIRYAGDRPRYSTCGGVCWFKGNQYVFAVNMQTSSVQIYEFKEETRSLHPVQQFNNSHGLGLKRPESLTVSKDGKLLAIPNMGNGKVQIYETSQTTFFKPQPAATIHSALVHGAQFSPDSKYLAIAKIGKNSQICVYRIGRDSKGQVEVTQTQAMNNHFEPVRPKSVAFSDDGRFVVIGYCMQLSSQVGEAKGAVATYKFDGKTGRIDPAPISSVDGLYSAETVAFAPDNSCFFAVDQVHDRVTGHVFDKKTGKIGEMWVALKNPESQLDFPHGIAFSPDRKYVAVSNYGDDKVTIYPVECN